MKIAHAKVSMYYLLLMAILVLGSALAIALYAGSNYMYDDVWYIETAPLLAQSNSNFILSKFSFQFLETTVYSVFIIGKYIEAYVLGLIAVFIGAITTFFVTCAISVNSGFAPIKLLMFR